MAGNKLEVGGWRFAVGGFRLEAEGFEFGIWNGECGKEG